MLQIKIGNRYLTKNNSIGERLLFMWLMNTVLVTITKYVLSKLSIYGLTRTYILWALTFVPIFLFLVKIKCIDQKRYLYFFLIFLLVVFSFILTAISNQDIGYFYTRDSYGLERVFRPDSAIYALLFFGLVEDIDELFSVVKRYAYINYVYLIVFLFLPAYLQGGWKDVSSSGTISLYQYSLSFGYAMLFPTIVFLYLFIKEKRIINLLFGIVGLLLILTNGSRGAMLMPFIFIGLMLINNILDSDDISWRIFKIGVIFVALLILLISWESIINYIVDALVHMGIKSRTLNLLISGELSNDNGRNVIWLAVVQAIRNGGIFGYGAYGDRPFVYPIHYVAYSHNLFLELVCSFGIIGILICFIIVISIVRMIFFCKDIRTRELFIIFVSISAQLLFSFSFWYVWEFWATIAIAHTYFRMRKKGIRLSI